MFMVFNKFYNNKNFKNKNVNIIFYVILVENYKRIKYVQYKNITKAKVLL